MRLFPRRTTLFVLFIALTVVAVGSSIWYDQSVSEANNPPTTVLGTANIDPSEPPPNPDPLATVESSPVSESIEANGRFYVAGEFSTVGGEPRTSLAAIDVATGHVDPTFAPVIIGSAGAVDAIAISPDGTDLYIGGRFTNVNGTSRSRIAKLDAITGALDAAFNGNINSQVETIATDGTSVWVGGNFATVNGGVAAPNLVKLDAVTGTLDPAWVGTAGQRVRDIELDINNVLWVGGNFDTIAGTAIKRLAPLDSTTGTVLATWVQGPDVPTPGVPLGEQHNLYAVSPAPDGSAVYVGTRGTPSSNPQGGNAVRKYDANGTLLWQSIGAGDTQALEATATTVYAGGHGNFVYTIERFNLDGTPNDGSVTPAGMTNDGSYDSNPNDTSFVGGTAANPNGYIESDENPNATRRNKLWSLDAATGDLVADWDPNLDTTDGVWDIESGPSGLLVGGDFRNVFNPSGISQPNDGVFTPHFTVFAGEGAGGNAAPEPLFTIDCAGSACNFDASGSLDDGTIASYAWDFGNGQTATGAAASTILSNNTTHDVTLTVTDDAGVSTSRVQHVVVGNGGLPIEPVATVSNVNTFTQNAVAVPAIAQAGDVATAFVSVNQSAAIATAPAGWTLAGDEADDSLRTFVFWKALDASDPGVDQVFTFADAAGTPVTASSNVTMSVFRGVEATGPIAAIGATPTTTRTAEHQAPALTFAGDATVIHYFAERTVESTEIFASPELATVNTTLGSNGAFVNSTLAIDPVLATNASVSRSAVTEHNGTNGHGWSVALVAAPAVPDTTAPVVTFTTALTQQVGPVDLDGGVTDDISGVDRVRVQVRNLQTNEYWNGTSWQTSWAWNLATLNGDDTWTLPAVNLDPAGTYRVALWAWDAENNRANWTDNPNPTITVTGGVADTTPPVVTFTTALTQQVGPVDLDGGVTDDISGVNRVRVQVRNLQTNEYWNGTSWQTSWAWNLATLNGDDTWTLPAVNFDPTGSYRVALYAWDNDENRANWTENPNPTITVTGGVTDTTPPVVTFTTALTQQVGPVDLDGGVTDDISGVDRVRVQVRNIQTNEFWNGTSWQTSWIWNLATLNGDDTWTLPAVNFDPAGTYKVAIWAWDVDNNRANWTDNPNPTITVQ